MKTKKITDYIEKKSNQVMVPARIRPETLEQAQEAAKKLNVSLRAFIEGAIIMACDQAKRGP